MKYSLTYLVLFFSVALAQNPNRSSIAPLAGVTHYVLDGEAVTGPTIGLRYLSSELSSSRLSLFGGVTVRPDGFAYYRTEPFLVYDQTRPYQLQPPISNGAMRESRFAFGLSFFGFDWRTYLADGSVRPYLGLGAQLVSWSSSSRLTGTITPDAMAGLEIHLSSGFDGFAEGRYSYGMPALFGSKFSRLRDVTMFAVGVSFAPRW
ncbi:MAG TPA: hypothetical protein VI758_00355 [Bacteroidota bacterium]